MTAMSFPMFLTLLILGIISSFVVSVLVRYQMLHGWGGFLAQWIAGYIGGWIGSPVLGHWGIHVGTQGNLFLIPAIIGAFSGSFLAAAMYKALALAAENARRASGAGALVSSVPPAAAPHVEMRKVS